MRSAPARCKAAVILAGITLVSGTHLAAQDVHELEGKRVRLRWDPDEEFAIEEKTP